MIFVPVIALMFCAFPDIQGRQVGQRDSAVRAPHRGSLLRQFGRDLRRVSQGLRRPARHVLLVPDVARGRGKYEVPYLIRNTKCWSTPRSQIVLDIE